jgi:hypothetical protein
VEVATQHAHHIAGPERTSIACHIAVGRLDDFGFMSASIIVP